ncbi:hypothetical protein CsatA_028851 [Cannabis sativa]
MNFRSWIAGGIPGLVPVLVWELFRFGVWQWELHAYILLVGLHSGLIPFLIYFYFRETGERASFREDRSRHGAEKDKELFEGKLSANANVLDDLNQQMN